jgi:very-short-patch-repair endonuclease
MNPSPAQLHPPGPTAPVWRHKHPGAAYIVRFVEKTELGAVLQACGGDPGRAASHVAARQRGVVDTEQLHLLGVSRHVIAHRLGHGLLHRLFRGVFLWGHPVPPAGALDVAGLLACRRRGILGLESAGAAWGFLPVPEEVTVLFGSTGRRSRPGLAIHRTTTLRKDEVMTCHGLPVTSPLRTLLDLAAADYRWLERAASSAHAAGLIDSAGLTEYVEGRSGVPGVPALRAIAGLEARGFTRSQNERRLRALCRSAGLPQPRTNLILCGWEVDFFWPEAGLIVEVDAFNTHGHRAQFERDSSKQADLVAAGHPVLRFHDRALHSEELAVTAKLAQALARCAWQSGGISAQTGPRGAVGRT